MWVEIVVGSCFAQKAFISLETLFLLSPGQPTFSNSNLTRIDQDDLDVQ